jgi:BirA family biotin operon repressor/biotin-[acetyl-CoA-carboxylase] ligase
MTYSTTPELPRLIHLHEVESTNRYLQQGAEAEVLPNESVVLADFQTSGRGQPGNSWESEAGQNLTFSLFYRLPQPISLRQPFPIAELAALSVKRTLDLYTSDITVKWPNDIYWKDLKICGILIENHFAGNQIAYSIIGIGLNLNQQIFHSNAPNPVSLTQITGLSYDRIEVLEQQRILFHRLKRQFETEGPESIHREYLSVLYRREGFYPYRDAGGDFEARIHNIEPSGHMVLERRDGALSRYAFKEVCHLIEPFYLCAQNKNRNE